MSGLISSPPAAFPDFNVSLRVCHELMPLLHSRDLQSILSIVKGFSHPLECYRQNP